MEAFSTILGKFNTIVARPVLALLFSLALLYFLWGIAQSLMKSDSETDRDTGKRHMIYGLIGMAIMFSVYGILNLISNTIGDQSQKVDQTLLP